jgi:stage II sporulation protein M
MRYWKAFSIMALGFLLGFIAGLLIPPSLTQLILDYMRDVLRRSGLNISLSPLLLMMLIFTNNLRVSLLIIVSGILIAGPLIILFINGAVVSAAYLYASSKTSPITAFLAIFPHGVVEIPAIINIAAASTIFWLNLWRKIMNKADIDISGEVITLLKQLVLTAALLFVAAIIEAFVTPVIANIPIYNGTP